MLSLQPSKDSAYAVADITPKKLKANLISVATEGALTDVPSNTANILAWNGAGDSNYTSIVEKGSYQARAAEEKEEMITIDFGKIEDEITVDAKKLGAFAKTMSSKIEAEVAEELKGFFAGLRNE